VESTEVVQLAVVELRSRILFVVEEFAQAHPGAPVQMVLASIGEVLLQLALTHLGPKSTLQFIEHLWEAAGRFGEQMAVEH